MKYEKPNILQKFVISKIWILKAYYNYVLWLSGRGRADNWVAEEEEEEEVVAFPLPGTFCVM